MVAASSHPLRRGAEARAHEPRESRSSAERNRERSAAANGFGPLVMAPALRRSLIRLRVASVMPMASSVKGLPVRRDDVGARLHGPRGERHVGGNHDIAVAGARR